MEGRRNKMDAEFRGIFEIRCEKGFRAIIGEAEFQLGEDKFTAWVEKLSAKYASQIMRCVFALFVTATNLLERMAQHDGFIAIRPG